MRSNLCWLSCVVFVISVLPLDLSFMIACYLFFLVEVSLCRCSCVVFLCFCIAFGSHFCDSVLFFGMRSNLSWLSCVFFISVLPLDLIFMIACCLCLVEMNLCRFSCVVFYISVLPLDHIFVIACYFLEWDRICVGFLVLFLLYQYCLWISVLW